MAKDLEYYLAQARRIEAHRDADFEKEIRKIYTDMLKDLRATLADAYAKWGTDDALTFAMLQKAGYEARFLEEIQQRVDVATKMQAARLRTTVGDSYKIAYESMVEGVKKASAGVEELEDIFEAAEAITPAQIKAAVENPVSGLTLSDRLEKNRKEIIYNIKQTVGVGLMNGDRYTTMAKRIAQSLDGDYKKAIRIARTETHRVREAGNIAAALQVDEELQNGTTEMRLVKTWRSMQDERVRPQKFKKGKKVKMGKGPENHIKMNGQVRLANEPFDMGHGGLTAMAPGQSGNAGDDINCRCYASYEMMDDDKYFAKTGKHFAITPEKKYLKQEKELLNEQTTLTKERDDAHDMMEALDQEQFHNIWKNPVTAKDYEKLKDRLDAKRDYFRANGKQDMLDLCDRFEEKGKKYLLSKNTFEAASKRLDDVAEELKETRLKLMKALKIDPKKIRDEIDDIKKKITAAQGSGAKKITLQTKVKNSDKELIKKAMMEADDFFESYVPESEWNLKFDLWGEDTIKKFMDDNLFTDASKTKFKQSLKKLANESAIDKDQLAALQKLLKDKEDELAAVIQRYGLDIADDRFSQKRKDKAYWFKGSNAKERADKVLRPDTGKLWQGATQAERAAAYKYTSGSGSFNRPLRGYDGSWYNFKGVGNVPLDREGSGDAIKELTNIIDRNPSKFDIWLQRGVESDSGAAGFLGISEKMLSASEDDLRQLLIGKVVKDEAFTSTAGAKGQGFSGRLILNIYAPEGTKFIYAEPFSCYGNGDGRHWDGIREQYSFGHEFEVLLQRGTSFKITKVEKSGYTIYADVDIVGQP